MKATRQGLKISVVGAGSVGTTLATMLHRSGNEIVAVVSRRTDSARTCGRMVSCRNCSDDVAVIPSSSNLVVIAVPDQAIRPVAESLAVLPNLIFKRLFVCHTSGAMTSDVLGTVARHGARVFSLHPIQTFPKQKSLNVQIRSMNGITYGFEGPEVSRAMAKKLVRQLGGDILCIPKEGKILYHLACVIASNYSVALIGALDAIAGKVTLKRHKPFEKLLQTSVENAMKLGAGKALTGPIVRGDAELVSEHLRSIHDPQLRSLYKSLGAYTLTLAIEEGRLTNEQSTRLRELLMVQE